MQVQDDPIRAVMLYHHNKTPVARGMNPNVVTQSTQHCLMVSEHLT